MGIDRNVDVAEGMAKLLEERVPLLSDGEQELPDDDDLSDLQVSFKQQRAMERAPQAQTNDIGHPSAGLAAPAEEASVKKRKHYSGNEMIVAVFVVQFDIRRGGLPRDCCNIMY